MKRISISLADLKLKSTPLKIMGNYLPQKFTLVAGMYSSPHVFVALPIESPLAKDRKTCRIGESFESLSIFLNSRDISSYISKNLPSCEFILVDSAGIVNIELIINGLGLELS